VTPTLCLPAIGVMSRLLTETVGRDVTVTKMPPLDLRSKAPKVYGVCRDADRSLSCLLVCDLPFCAYTGGAMLLFPLFAITDAIRTGEFEEDMFDAVREILNICTQMFNEHGHQVLQQVCTTSQELPEEAAAVLRSPAGRLDVSVSVAGGGDGRITMLIGR
jgi:hypothetical protein